jgi:pyrroloquinoline quinone biosynthesis protein B
MKAIVLGSAAGGGAPQWNCYCDVCSLFWKGDERVMRRTQSSLALSVDDKKWVLLNCSPDILEQIRFNSQLHPQSSPRHSPICAVVLTNGDIDHIGGLLSLRESQSFDIWASAEVTAQIKANPIFQVLNEKFVVFKTIETGKAFEPVPGLSINSFLVPGKVPLYREQGSDITIDRSGNTVGLHIKHDGRQLSYVPGCAEIDAQLLKDLRATNTLLFDGTLWNDQEMITSNTGQKTGRRMGHSPVSGEDGSMAKLIALNLEQKIFVHMNNTNPMLIAGSQARQDAEAQGWQVSYDGMMIEP